MKSGTLSVVYDYDSETKRTELEVAITSAVSMFGYRTIVVGKSCVPGERDMLFMKTEKSNPEIVDTKKKKVTK